MLICGTYLAWCQFYELVTWLHVSIFATVIWLPKEKPDNKNKYRRAQMQISRLGGEKLYISRRVFVTVRVRLPLIPNCQVRWGFFRRVRHTLFLSGSPNFGVWVIVCHNTQTYPTVTKLFNPRNSWGGLHYLVIFLTIQWPNNLRCQVHCPHSTMGAMAMLRWSLFFGGSSVLHYYVGEKIDPRG